MANTLTISYNANGGSGAPVSTVLNATIVVEGYRYQGNLSSTKPSRSHYTFLGWSTSSSATSASYAAGAAFSRTYPELGTYTLTLYAVWKKNKITISYSANGGSGAPASQTVNEYEWFNLSSTIPTRTGYTFNGWEYNGNVYAAGSAARFVASVTLSASWSKITYTITYNGNGNTGGTVPSAQTKEYGTNLTLSSSVPTRTNYTFLGWSTSNTATTATYTAGGTYTANAGATLYAVWKLASRTITLTYNANGGSGAPSAQSETTTASSVTFALSNVSPTRTNYNFLGWADSSGATTAQYNYPTNITLTDNKTIYAVWALKTYTVSFNGNGGSGVPANQTKTHGVNLTLSNTTPTRDGYNFLGWATSASATTAQYSAGGTYSTDASTILYAVWQIKTYTISYNANGGSGAPANQTKTHGVDIQISGVKPYRSGKIFMGWDDTNVGTVVVYRPYDVYSYNGDLTLYAVWADATYDSADIFVDGDSCEIYVRGKNLLDPKIYSGGTYNASVGTQWTLTESSQQLTNAGNDFSVSLGSWSTRTFIMKVTEGTTYHVKAVFSGDNIATSRGFLSADYKVLSTYNLTGASADIDTTITPTSGQEYFYILFAPRTTTQTITISSPQIEFGSSATEYEPYIDGLFFGAELIMI